MTAQSSGQCASTGQATPSQGQAAGKCNQFAIKQMYLFACGAGQFSWNAGGEVVMGVGSGAPPVPIDTGSGGRGMGDEVEVMSTDSSSSSSTDSN